jgi:glutathione synthase/RimK-type ligase-like ATP-grasp enzyme
MKCLMAITHSKDKTVDYLMHKYKSRVKWFRLNADLLDTYDITMTVNGLIIRCSEYEVADNQIDSVLYRKIVYPELAQYYSEYIPLLQRDILSFVEGIAETLGSTCLSRPSLLRRAENKLVQLNEAKIAGFSIPHSLITNSSNEATNFTITYPSVIKPLSTGVVRNSLVNGIIQTNLVDLNRPIEHLGSSPSYFQEYKKKDDGEYRVTFVGRDYVAVRIDSNHSVDWRKREAINKYEVVDLPYSLIKKCYDLMDRLGIAFGAFDFIRTGMDYYFLEVNPNGQWLWLEQELKTPISELIISYLERGDIS